MGHKRINTGKVSSDLYPFESRYMTVGSHQLHYLEEGRGDPVVMLHGNPSWSFITVILFETSPFHIVLCQIISVWIFR
jgi:hypothetical protein